MSREYSRGVNSASQVVEAKFRGIVSAALFCDNHPVLTHFRKISDTMIFGIMTGKFNREAGPMFFYLTRYNP